MLGRDWRPIALKIDDASLHGDDDGLGPVLDVEAAEDDVDVPLHSAAGDIESGGDFLIVEAFDDQAKDFDFAGAEGRFSKFGGDVVQDATGDVAFAGVDAADGLEEFQVGHSFEDVGLGSSGESFADVLVALISGEDDDGAGGAVGEDGFGGFDAAHFGHAEIHEDHVGQVFAGEEDGFGSGAGLADDGHVGLGVDDAGDAHGDDGVVIGDEDTDGGGFGGPGLRDGLGCAEGRCLHRRIWDSIV